MADPTTLNLLTRDGVVTVTIKPPLDSDHYPELHDIVCDAETADELRDGVRMACNRWGREVQFN
jgi:hypothetical protein